MPLDNAALIFPAIRRAEWVNVFRVSMTLKEDIDPRTLQRAVDHLKPRFPSVYVRLGSGLFWYFLEEVHAVPRVRQDYAYPLTHMGARELRRCCFRVLYYKNRIAVEFFHALTDGSGGMIFLKTLAAEYLRIKYGTVVPPTGEKMNRKSTHGPLSIVSEATTVTPMIAERHINPSGDLANPHTARTATIHRSRAVRCATSSPNG